MISDQEVKDTIAGGYSQEPWANPIKDDTERMLEHPATKWTERYNFLRFWLQIIGIIFGGLVWFTILGLLALAVFS